MTPLKSYRFCVFGLSRSPSSPIENIVAEGNLPLDHPPFVSSSEKEVANYIYQYLFKETMQTHYIAFSFKPNCSKVIYEGDVYCSQVLSEQSQANILSKVKDSENFYYEIN
ncbi:hypothetical protein SMSP2_01777 [Limihaloglobus sulfuriphilus]|uniref:Uncharacterized protein n=1 Tax=Limihaloglobus sulfuriphilus TaxID=1851148 RepID=A0A1Q2MFC5_9BACT|nr:hypothetical protein SMSP2_01777 [Limihaloglobus sulfuriphilus]